MTITQLSVFLENKPGHLANVCKILSNNGINLLNMMIADTKEFGIVRIIVKEWEKAKELLEKSGFTVKTVEVMLAEVDHTPGGLGKVLTFLGEKELGVDYMYAFPQSMDNDSKSVIVIKFHKQEEAMKVMKNYPDIVFSSKEFYK